MNIKKAMENQDSVFLEWVEPWPALNEDGTEKTACMWLRASVRDCIAMHRHYVKSMNRPDIQYTDERHLEDFLVVHWATIVGTDNEMITFNDNPDEN